jgi:hypothetical protein
MVVIRECGFFCQRLVIAAADLERVFGRVVEAI